MGKVYKNFDELVSHNAVFFKFLTKDGQTSLLRACWDARDSEMENYHKEIETLKAKLLEMEEVHKAQEHKLKTSEGHIKELRTYAEEVRSTAVAAKTESIGATEQMKAIGEENVELQLRIRSLEEVMESNRAEVETNLLHAHKLKELVAASNAYADEQAREATACSNEAKQCRQIATEKEQENSELKAELTALHKKITELEISLDTVRENGMKKSEECEALRKGLFEMEAEFVLKEKLIVKLRLDFEEARLGREQYEVRYLRLDSDFAEKTVYVEELEKYVTELREDGARSKETAFKARENVDRLKTYCDSMEIELERAEKKQTEAQKYAGELEKFISVMKEDNEKLKSEIYRLNVVLNKIQTSLGQIHGVGGPRDIHEVIANN
ncbi:MAG: hypothetical protein A2X86_18950 [Bdellovibrionales bacterium GWA2_49_15]|nr:MAG: hypothetical protein A2X86_18950 [Bdellovibrionales bacterium GWA2_49_15]HAZ14305.1 hypothetical protein [Bdellovibrionales bacterium]